MSEMNEDPRLIIAFSKAIEESTCNGFGLLDRDTLLAILRALMTLKGQIEGALADLDARDSSMN